ncbi:MAG: alpha/beta hydrolase, partial [Kiritimatiellales bacterium]
MVKLKFFLSVVLIHSAGFYGFCEDIIQNGHFEQGLTEWTVSWKAEPLFKANSSPECSLVYSRTENQLPEANAFVKQTIALQPDRYYDLTVDYRTDSDLTPFIWITAGDDKISKPIRLIRLPNNPSRSVFKSLLNIEKNKGPFSFQVYPGIDPQDPMLNHSRPKSGAAGTAELFSITLTPSSFRDPEPVRLDEKMRTETVTYKTVDSMDLVLKLDFPLNPPKEKMPIIFWVHGGGWVTGSPDTMLWRSSQLAPLGIANARVQYRLIKNGGTFPKSFGDLLDAVQWLRNHADEYNIDINRMVISGGSAGGQLSSTLAQKTPECIGYM